MMEEALRWLIGRKEGWLQFIVHAWNFEICRFCKFYFLFYFYLCVVWLFFWISGNAVLKIWAMRRRRRRLDCEGNAGANKFGYTDTERVCIELRDLQVWLVVLLNLAILCFWFVFFFESVANELLDEDARQISSSPALWQVGGTCSKTIVWAAQIICVGWQKVQ